MKLPSAGFSRTKAPSAWQKVAAALKQKPHETATGMKKRPFDSNNFRVT